jgi:hypothetical protein
MSHLYGKIKELFEEYDIQYTEKHRTFYLPCPVCGKSEKFSMLKNKGSTICYRASCDYGQKSVVEWLMLVGNLTKEDASKKINENTELKVQDSIYRLKSFDEIETETEKNKRDQVVRLGAIPWPAFGTLSLKSDASIDAAKYLESRGLSIEIAETYGIRYNVLQRRVVLPVLMDGECYGYQGRAIDKVDSGFRMRNNEGFQRANLVMFLDNLKTSKHVILTEGPFDGLKFHKVGGFITTMGKEVSNQQLELIQEKARHIDKWYVAFDDDAVTDMKILAKRIKKPLHRLIVPESCVVRCKAEGKKADFGECTFDEAEESLINPIKIGYENMMF